MAVVQFFRGILRIWGVIGLVGALALTCCAMGEEVNQSASLFHDDAQELSKQDTESAPEAFDALMQDFIAQELENEAREEPSASFSITSFSPVGGAVGDEVIVTGRGFESLSGEVVLFFGDAPAVPVSITDTEVHVVVPEGAVSAPIRVSDSTGEALSKRSFLVMQAVPGIFQPPRGVAEGEFVITSAYTSCALSDGAFELRLPVGKMSIVAAVKLNTESSTTYLASVMPDPLNMLKRPAGGVTIDAYSTAETLVFMHPFLMTSDPVGASRVRSVMAETSAVHALANVIAARYPVTEDGLADPAVETAWNEAVIAVIDAMPESFSWDTNPSPRADSGRGDAIGAGLHFRQCRYGR